MSHRDSRRTSFSNRGRDRIGEIEFFVQQTRVGLDVSRLVHDLRGGVKLRIHTGNLLNDFGRAYQCSLFTVEEL
jgi:hypothetical protein